MAGEAAGAFCFVVLVADVSDWVKSAARQHGGSHLRGHVVDSIQWYWRDWYWSAFNLADVAIIVGAAPLILQGNNWK